MIQIRISDGRIYYVRRVYKMSSGAIEEAATAAATAAAMTAAKKE